jgi:hypothetical protein
MESEPSRQVELFFVKAYDPIRKKSYRTRWKMTREDAARKFPDGYKILEHTKEVRTVGGDSLHNSAARLYDGWKK